MIRGCELKDRCQFAHICKFNMKCDSLKKNNGYYCKYYHICPKAWDCNDKNCLEIHPMINSK